jgi:hypothetical protein
MISENNFWYWLSDNAKGFEGENINRLPFDAHFARALIAPRPLLTIDGLDDTWANPYGAQVSWLAAQPVYDMLGAGDNNAIHMREGGHAYNEHDWQAALSFCDEKLRGKNAGRLYKTYIEGKDPSPSAFLEWAK